MRLRGVVLSLAAGVLCLIAGLAPESRAGTSRMTPGQVDAVTSWPFWRAHVGPPNSMRNRDLEFWWDSLYIAARGEVGVSDSIRWTLDSLGTRICDGSGLNPRGVPRTDIALVYDYFNPLGDTYNSSPIAQYGFAMGDTSFSTQYSSGYDYGAFTNEPRDRGHVDFYLYASRHLAHSNYDYGMWPSNYYTAKEDSSTGHWASPDTFVVSHSNSIMAGGPLVSERLVDLDGTGWTKDGMVACWEFAHEFQHGLFGKQERYWNPDLLYPDKLLFNEMFSSAAEGIAGNYDDQAVEDEFPSMWSLFQHNPFTRVWNYQGRRAYTEYLGSKFRGADTAATAFRDDLLSRWARSEPNLNSLDSLLADATCPECAGYFGAGTDRHTRFDLLFHDFQIAAYVNNPTLAQGQFGYPPQSGFDPAVDLRAWQSFAGSTCDDSVSVPPNLIASRRWVHVDTTIVGLRAGCADSCPSISMRIPMFGAQYWVVRSDASLAQGAQDLRVRISLEDIYNSQYGGGEFPPYDGRLIASVVPYVQQALGDGTPDSLWKHPEWARAPLPPQWIDVDSAATALELTVPEFGDTYKAALVVVSLVDGPRRTFLTDQPGALPNLNEGIYQNAAGPRRYRLSLAVREAGADTSDVRMVARTASQADDHPTWAPSGNTIAFESKNPAISSLQQVYTVATSGGAPTRLYAQQLKQSSPDWSPRGDWIASLPRPPAVSPASGSVMAPGRGTG